MYLAKEEWIKKIDLIDEMRSKFSAEVNEALKLPQIIVVGDQSSGKSSILQAISGIKLPRGVNTVTRCPVVMQMRKSTETRIQIKYRSEPFKDISDTESEIREIQHNVFKDEITKDPITIRIQSPEVVTLTIIDLPGLVKADVRGQARDMIEKTHEIARDFMMLENSLIICVLPANQDICTTTTIKEATECNPGKSRIIGVLTKLDKLDEKEVTLIPEIIRNQKLPIEKGYYGLIVNTEILELTDKDDRSETERRILKAKNLWNAEDVKRFGLSNFTEALSKELVVLINKTLPILRRNVDDKLKSTTDNLETFSKYYGSEEIQKKYISQIIKDIEKKTKNMLVMENHEIRKYGGIKEFLNETEILSSVEGNETFLYMWHEIFKDLFNNFNAIYKDFFDANRGKYRDEKYLERLIRKNRTENMSIFISSKPFKNIVNEVLIRFKVKASECVETCCEIILFIIDNVLATEIEPKLSSLQLHIQKISRKVLSDKKSEIENNLTFLFNSERSYFSLDEMGKSYGKFTSGIDDAETLTIPDSLFSFNSAPLFESTTPRNDNLKLTNGKILKNGLENYLTNAISRLAIVIPNFIRRNLFIDFSKGLTDALELDILYKQKSMSYFSLTAEEQRELEELRATRKSLEEFSNRLNDFHC